MTITPRKLYGKLYQLYLWLRYKLFHRRRMHRLVLERLEGIPLVILPDVFNPTLFVTGRLFIEALRAESSFHGRRVLDVGCGSGILGIAAAKLGASVVAVDLNEEAVRCTRINALLNDVEIDTRPSDLFQAVDGERFDCILFSPPLFIGEPKSGLEMAFFSSNIMERFFDHLRGHLAPGGHALVLASSTARIERFHAGLARNELHEEAAVTRVEPSETYHILRIAPAVPT